MNPEDFIKKHITDALVGEGLPLQVAQGGGMRGTGSLPSYVSGKSQGEGV